MKKFDPHKDYYAVLGLTKEATSDTIRSEYRKKARENHPDRGGSKETFQAITEAYEVLNDEETRKAYNETRSFSSGSFRTNFSDPFRVNFNDIFSDIFSKGVNANRQTSSGVNLEYEEGSDIDISIKVPLHEAFTGIKKEITVCSGQSHECSTCNGSGAAWNSGFMTCIQCNGRKYTIRTTQGAPSHVTRRRCAGCSGLGKVPLTVCITCKGKRKLYSSRSITITIPPGVSNGDRLRIAGQGTPGINSSPGDLYVSIDIEPDSDFVRKDMDLHTQCRVPLMTALKGGSYKFTHLGGGILTVQIPKGIKPGETTLRIVGQGMKHPMRHVSGDLFLSFEVELPELSDDQISEVEKVIECSKNVG